MSTPNIANLAPNLSAEERYKLIVPDYHNEIMGRAALLSDSERQAIMYFTTKASWEEFVQKYNTMLWAQVLWPKDIEAEKLRVVALSLLLNHSFVWVLRVGGDQSLSMDKRNATFKELKEHVALMEEQSITFYAYRAALEAITKELYGIPVFNDVKMAEVRAEFEKMDELIDYYNDMVREFCEVYDAREHIEPIVDDMQSYLVKKSVPDATMVEGIIDDIRQVAAAVTRLMGR
jgi:hypothetical protein